MPQLEIRIGDQGQDRHRVYAVRAYELVLSFAVTLRAQEMATRDEERAGATCAPAPACSTWWGYQANLVGSCCALVIDLGGGGFDGELLNGCQKWLCAGRRWHVAPQNIPER